MPVFESLSSTVQSAETIQESIGAHYTLKLIQKENKNSVSKKYKQDLIFGCEQGVDFVAASFIRKRSDVIEI
ncbi:pyruvate kinase, partial [Escherichia coli]|uniref:pyruvate kinase n=1 Tax=Escherichia coli TaxID=562 RepID=UPI0035104F26